MWWMLSLLTADAARHRVRLSADADVVLTGVRISRAARRALPDREIVCSFQVVREKLQVTACRGAPREQVQSLVSGWRAAIEGEPSARPPLALHILSEPRAVIFLPPRSVERRGDPLAEPVGPHAVTFERHLKRKVPVHTPRWRRFPVNVPEQCSARVELSRRGEPLMVEVLDCPSRWREAVVSAVWGWRYYPVKVDGERVPGVVEVDVPLR